MTDAYTPADANMSSEGGSSTEAPPPSGSGSGSANPSGLSQEELDRLQREDKPLEDDPVGNAIPGLIVGGAEGLIEGGVHFVGAVIGEAGVAIAEHLGGDGSSGGEGSSGGGGAGGSSAGGDDGSGSD